MNKKARLPRAFCSPHSGAWRSTLGLSRSAKPSNISCVSLLLRGALHTHCGTPRGRLESGGAGAISERKGSSGALPSTSPPLLLRSLRFPQRVVPIISPHTLPLLRTQQGPTRNGKAERAGARRAPGLRAPGTRGSAPTQDGAPGGWRGETCAEPRAPPHAPSAAPLRAPSPQGLPPARRRGRGGHRSVGGRGPGHAPGLRGLGPPASPTHPPATPRPPWPPRRGASQPAGRPATRPPPRSARPAPAPSFTSSRSGSPRHPGNAAPLPPSLLHRRGGGPGSGDRRQPISNPPGPRAGEARARGGSSSSSSGGREGPRGRGGSRQRRAGPRGGKRPLSPAA